MDLGWGGVPRMQPSDTALSYLNSIHKFVVSFFKHAAAAVPKLYDSKQYSYPRKMRICPLDRT